MPHVTVAPGVSVSYRVYGSGTPVLFVPPPGVGSAVFRRQVQGLSPHCQVIVFELRGHGGSTASPVPLTYPVVASDIRAILDDLNLHKSYLCGYSMGASVVFEFIRSFPDRVQGGIALSGFSEATDWRIRAEITSAIACARLPSMDTLGLALAAANADDARSFSLMYRTARHANKDDVTNLFAYALEYNCSDALPSFGVPMQLMFGAEDGRLRRYAEILRAGLPRTEVVYIVKARHQIPMKFATAVNERILDFVLHRERGAGFSETLLTSDTDAHQFLR